MKKRIPDKFWFPWWPDKWIFGSIRIECTPAERGIWVDLLSLASKDDGYIQANEETPYPIQQLAGMLIIPEKELDAAIKKFTKMMKLTKKKTGTLYVTEWEKYQFSERHKRRVEDSMEPQENEDEFFYKSAIRCPPAFSDMANKSGTIRMSRLVIAVILGRSLKSKEEVHHIGKENDHRPGNLMLFANHEDHGQYEYGYEITPVWDGARLSKTAETAIIAKIKAVIVNKNTINKNTLNKNKIKKTLMSSSFKNNIILKWNTLAQKYNLPAIMEIEPGSVREKNLRARSANKNFDFDLLLDIINNSPFLLGKTKNPFFVFFDWIIKPTNYQKIIEGNYLDRQSYQRFSGIIQGIKNLEKKYAKEKKNGT